MTLAEAAEYLRVPAETLKALAEKDSIPARKIGSEWRFFKSALQEWLRGEAGSEERQLRLVPCRIALIEFDRVVDELERRLVARLAPSKPLPEKGSKERVLQMAGKWKDDPTLEPMLREIFKQRGRPLTEEDE